MASLRQAQVAILVWIVESGESTVVLSEGLRWTTLIAGRANLEVKPADVRELETQGLIRHTSGHGYDLTNEGASRVRPDHESKTL